MIAYKHKSSCPCHCRDTHIVHPRPLSSFTSKIHTVLHEYLHLTFMNAATKWNLSSLPCHRSMVSFVAAFPVVPIVQARINIRSVLYTSWHHRRGHLWTPIMGGIHVLHLATYRGRQKGIRVTGNTSRWPHHRAQSHVMREDAALMISWYLQILYYNVILKINSNRSIVSNNIIQTILNYVCITLSYTLNSVYYQLIIPIHLRWLYIILQ